MRKIGFTGSTAVGQKLMAGAAKTIKKVSLELGGNAPFVVFADADLERAAQGTVAAALRNAGQTCICANRVFVQVNVLYSFPLPPASSLPNSCLFWPLLVTVAI